jgi:hypothetical protein
MRPYVVDRWSRWSIRRRWYWTVQISPEGWNVSGWARTRRGASLAALRAAVRPPLCETCLGTGWSCIVETDDGDFTEDTCPDCQGSGQEVALR